MRYIVLMEVDSGISRSSEFLKKVIGTRDILKWIALVLFVFLGVSLDLYTTNLAISRGFYETRLYGNQPYIYYSWMFGCITMLFLVNRTTRVKLVNSLGFILILIIAALPFTAAFYNLGMLGYV